MVGAGNAEVSNLSERASVHCPCETTCRDTGGMHGAYASLTSGPLSVFQRGIHENT